MLAVVCGRFYEWRLIWVSCNCTQMKAILFNHISFPSSCSLAHHFICLWFLACCCFFFVFLFLFKSLSAVCCLMNNWWAFIYRIWTTTFATFILFAPRNASWMWCTVTSKYDIFTAWQGTFLINAIKVIKTVVQLQQNMCAYPSMRFSK